MGLSFIFVTACNKAEGGVFSHESLKSIVDNFLMSHKEA